MVSFWWGGLFSLLFFGCVFSVFLVLGVFFFFLGGGFAFHFCLGGSDVFARGFGGILFPSAFFVFFFLTFRIQCLSWILPSGVFPHQKPGTLAEDDHPLSELRAGASAAWLGEVGGKGWQLWSG